jgi:hypothetical protein
LNKDTEAIMRENKQTREITDVLAVAHAVLLLKPIDESMLKEILLRSEGHVLRPTPATGVLLQLFDTHEMSRSWLDAVGELLGAADIQYILFRMVSPVTGACGPEVLAALNRFPSLAYVVAS